VNGHGRHLGCFDTVEEAARAYARAQLRQHGEPPAPPAQSAAEQFRQEEEGKEEIDLEPFRSKNSSGYRGVSLAKKTRKYSASHRVKDRTYFLGTFDTKKEAARAISDSTVDHLPHLVRDPVQK